MPKFQFPKPPQPPRLNDLLGGANPMRNALDDVRGMIIAGKEGITSIAEALSLEGDTPHRGAIAEPQEQIGIKTGIIDNEIDTTIGASPITTKEAIKGGTAGVVCSDEHVTMADSELKEALRMARSRGLQDDEVRERLKGARDELNSMERRDMVAEKILSYPPEQQVIARWLLKNSASLRHSISEMLMADVSVEELEKTSAMAAQTAREFTKKVSALPKEQKANDECLNVKQLKQFVEERHKEG